MKIPRVYIPMIKMAASAGMTDLRRRNEPRASGRREAPEAPEAVKRMRYVSSLALAAAIACMALTGGGGPRAPMRIIGAPISS